MHSLNTNHKKFSKQYSYQDLQLQGSRERELQHNPSEKRTYFPQNNFEGNNESRYCEEYSFNRIEESERNIGKKNNEQRQIYQPSIVNELDSSLSSNPQLLKKYSSICNELKNIQLIEIIQLFLQEIQENQRNKQKILQKDRQIRHLQDQLIQNKSILQKKRQAISLLCQTETNNLNLIQTLQKQINNKHFSFDSHCHQKYKELQNYMNQYIASTNLAQEEFIKNYKIVKNQNGRILQMNQKINQELFQKTKMLDIVSCKLAKIEQTVAILKEKEMTFNIKIDNLEEENQTLKKDLQEIMENLKATEQFQVELAKENRELSSQLDFIKDKINQNQNISKDIFQKMEENSTQNQLLLKQVEKLSQDNVKLQNEKTRLQSLLNEQTKDRKDIQNQKQQLMQDYQQICRQSDLVRSQNQKILNLLEQKNSQIEKLMQEMETLNQYQQQIIGEYECQRQSKNQIKAQLIQLAGQVKFMESTYKKQVVQNQKIKQELHKFWEKKDSQSRVMKQMCYNDSFDQESGRDQKNWTQCDKNYKAQSGNNNQVNSKWKNTTQNNQPSSKPI